MLPNSSCIKYYWLEKEFFPEVHTFFRKEHYLTPEQFFSIIFWKSIRPRKKIKDGLIAKGDSLTEAVRKLTKEIFEADTDEKRLSILLNRKGFKLAMASALLTVLYPNNFTVYDYRVRGQLREQKDISYRKNVVKLYFEFVELVKKSNLGLSLRDCDRNLWAKSWYEDLQNFLRS